ncbi:phage portal protein [Streptomyces sp. p1417]|uniref:Phage portal protein n=1 Tax=Streptomyces typhae TaxID=2681492 RepID=A0A6L6WSN6_9ACTN|nr:phage portal protein [Streptomyces typhae]
MARTLLGALLSRTATANLPVPLVGRAATYGAYMQRRDAEGQMRAMSAVGTLFAIVDRTSNATALVDWKLYRKARSGRDEDRVEVTSHAALDLWNRPNPFMPRQEFVESSTQHYDLTGETEWVIARRPGVSIPLEMWPVRPDRMTPVPDRETFLKGWVYTSPDGEQIPLGLDEVIQLRRPNPLDPYRGLSPVLSILPDLDTSRYAAEWSRAFFVNSAQPGGIIEVPQALSDQEFDELRERWNEQHRGVGNAHRVAILEHGKWVDRTISQRDMQFVELRGATADRVREAYGISKTAIGDFEDINRASALAAKSWFAEQMTIPRLERIKAALNHELLPMFGRAAEGLEFDYENPVPPDAETEATTLTAKVGAAAALIEAGAYGPAVLEAFDLPEIQFGAPGADPDRELLIKLVTRAPLLAPTILPMLGFDVPEKPTTDAPPPQDEPAPTPPADDEPVDAWGTAVAGLLGEDVEAAMRYEAVAHIDDNTCGPCADNDGRVYRNRAQAYKDYPGGRGYVKCVGAEHGNECRCVVRKRKKTRDDE